MVFALIFSKNKGLTRMKVLLVNIFSLLLITNISLANEEESSLEGLLSHSIPSFHLDHWGFELPEDFALSNNEWSPVKPLLAVPIISQKFGRQKIIGVKVKTSRSHLKSGYSFSTIPTSSESREAMNYVRTLELEGQPLVPVQINGDIYGIPPGSQLRIENSKSFGLEFNYNGFSNNVVELGEKTKFGLSFDIGFAPYRFEEVKGLHFDPFKDIFSGIDFSLNSSDLLEIARFTSEFYPAFQAFLIQNFNMKNPSNKKELLSSVYSYQVEQPMPNITLTNNIKEDLLSKELQSNLKRLREKIDKELEWKDAVQKQVDATLVLNDPQAGSLIQSICDLLAQAYNLPQEVWPRCRIAATMNPNAWAYPGGDIFISTGLIGLLPNLDSVIHVLGHEIGHVVGRHTTKTMPISDTYFFTAVGTNIAMSLYTLGAGWGTLGKVDWWSWVYKTQGLTYGGGYSLDVVFRFLASGIMAYSRSNEKQSDRFGFETAYALGSNPEAMTEGWEAFRDFVITYLGPTEGFWAKLLASHPDIQKRAAQSNKSDNRVSDKLIELGKSNRLPESFYKSYLDFHNQYKDQTQKYGQMLLEKKRSKSPISEHVLNSYLTPGGRCVVHSLLMGAH